MNSLSYTLLLIDNPTFSDNLSFMLVGFALVMIGLISLALMTQLNGLIFGYFGKPENPVKAKEVASSLPSSDEIDGHTIAVLTAAAYTVCGRRVRLTQVKPMIPGSWSQEGRQEIQGSHNIWRNMGSSNREF